MKKEICAVFALVCFIVTAFCGMAFAAAGATVQLTGVPSVQVGNEVSIQIQLQSQGMTDKLDSNTIILIFDALKFEYVNAKVSDRFVNSSIDESNAGTGTLKFGFMDLGNGIDISTQTVFATVALKARKGGEGTNTKITFGTPLQLLFNSTPLAPENVKTVDLEVEVTSIPTGTLKLDLTPGNAEWKVLGGGPDKWLTSADIYTVEIPTAESVTKTVEFKPTDGYFTPANKTYTIKKGANTDSVSYVKKGSVKATLTPAAAKWRLAPVDPTGTWRDSGYEYTNLEAGTYTVIYGDVSGYATPSPKTITISATNPEKKDNAWDASANYAAWGTLTISIIPEAVKDKAQWYVDGNSADKYASGHKQPLQGGSHDIYFTDVDGYTTPKVLTVSIADAKDVSKEVEYIAKSLLTVTLSPDSVAANGGKWILGGKEYASKAGVKVDAGTYSISFKAAAHFFTPAAKNVTVVAGQPKNELVEYTEKGNITVNLTPAAGQWRLNTDAADKWRGSGTSAEDLGAAAYTISYRPMDGHVTPADETVNISAAAKPGENTKVIARQYAEHGTLTVTITPDVISGDARWYLTTDAAKEYRSGTTLSLAPGDYTIAFKEVSGYTTPAEIPVAVPAATPVNKTGEYKKIETGTIKVTIEPEAVSADARWYVDGDTENGYTSGQSVTVAIGGHTVSFAKIGGYNTPADEEVTIAADDAKELTATYTANSGGGGGGCNAGVAAFALLFIPCLWVMRKR